MDEINIVEIDPLEFKPPQKVWVIHEHGVFVTDDFLANPPEWREETDQETVARLTSAEFNAAAELATIELFGGHLFGLESFDLQ